MKVGSLFAGIGGFDIAAERAGMEVAWQSEIDPHASRVLEHYWPGRNLGDIHNIRIGLDTDRSRTRTGSEPDAESRVNDRDTVTASDHPNAGGTDERTATAVDVLTGGFPCQDYSVAGNRAGLAGDRGALWWEYHRLIAQGRPTWVIGENVPGLLSSRGGEDFATIIDSLTQLGYGVVWGVLDAQYFGVAQRRRRVFIVGHSGGQPRPEILALSEGVHGYPQPVRASGGSVAHALTQRTHKGGDPTTDTYIAFAQNQRDEVRDLNNVAGALAAEPGMKQQTYVTAPTVRRLTPLECERLQGFPDGWTDTPGNSDTQRYRQLGNAVAVPVVEWILRRVADAV